MAKQYKEYHKNPRKISAKQLKALKETIKELGDISGIIVDLNTNEIISGNQRSKVIDLNDCKIEIVEQFDNPDKFGTVSIGYVIWKGIKLNYREVRWTDEQREKANIVANKGGGNWDFEVLALFNREKLLDFGFEEFELDEQKEQPQENGTQYNASQFGDGEGGEKKKEDCKCPKCGFVWQK